MIGLPTVEEYERLAPVARALFEHNRALSLQLMLPLFLISVAVGYTADLGLSGAILVRLKRLILASILLAAFPAVAEFTQVIGVEIAKSIDDMQGIDRLLEAASHSASSFSGDVTKLLFNLGGGFLVGGLAYISYLLLLFARCFLLAFQHFYWFLMVALAPFMILGMLFEASSSMTKSLFKNMFQIAAWPIIWSVLSAFLKALPFAAVYSSAASELVSICVMNLIFAVALLMSPFIVSQICDGVNLSVGGQLRAGVLNAVSVATGPKGIAARVASGRIGQSAFKTARSAYRSRK